MYTPSTVLTALHHTPAIADFLDSITPISQEWSASGALHFEAVHRATRTPVLVKVGLSDNELFWSEETSRRAPDLVPTLFASGRNLPDLPLAWKVVEHAQGGVLGPQWGGREFDMLLESGVAFQQMVYGIQYPNLDTRTCDVVAGWLRDALPHQPPGPAQELVKRVEEHYAWVSANCEIVTCHGDLHMCNGVTRREPPGPEKVLLIDFAVCRQPWAFEAARLQVLNSTDPTRPGWQELVYKMAALRVQHGLSTCPDLERLSKICLAWFALVMWHLIPPRRELPGYRERMEEYVAQGASA